MATQKLFGNTIKPACKYCSHAYQQLEDQVLCLKKGVVPPDYSCKKFDYDPTKRIPPKPLPTVQYEEGAFQLN